MSECITYGSVCSGIESATTAWHPLGMKPSWFSEIEPFPCAVLDHHWPDVPNMGDMLNLPYLVREGLINAPDILVGGTPCQAFSVAGLRKGMDDDRGKLSMTYVDLVDAIDEKRVGNECISVWENVPGVLSVVGNPFGCFLGALCGANYELKPGPEPAMGKSNKYWRWDKVRSVHVPKWTSVGRVDGPKRAIAWRVLDAKYFGVAQRRRRIFVIASARDGFDPGKVLFESEGLRRDIAPERETGETVGSLTASGVGTCGTDIDQAAAGHVVLHRKSDIACYTECEDAGTLTMSDSKDPVNLITIPIDAWAVKSGGVDGRGPGNGFGIGENEAPSSTLTAQDRHAVFCFAENQRGEVRFEDGDGQTASTLNSGGGKPGQGYPAILAFNGLVGNADPQVSEELTPTLLSTHNTCGVHTYAGGIVRRLMPSECERLQGFPGDHTLIPYNGKMAKDGPRHKAIGNSKAVPVIKWVGERIIKELGNANS